MANYTLTGVLGSGKSVTAVWKAMNFMTEGKLLATNMDLWPENYLPPTSRATHVRLPDFPSSDDFWNIGVGSTSPREDTFGAVILDELATFLNSRDWQGKARDKTIHFLRHIRKRRFHTFFLAQDIESLDKQARNALIEHVVICRRTDRLSIPVIGAPLRFLGFSGKLPQFHFANVKYGKDIHSPIVESWKHRGNKLYDVYNTEQIFTDEDEREIILKGTLGEFPAWVTGTYTVLSPWHLKGRYMSFMDRNRFRITAFSMLFLVISLSGTWFHYQDIFTSPEPKQVNDLAVVNPEPMIGVIERAGETFIVTQSGRVLQSNFKLQNEFGTNYKVGQTWYKKP